MECPKCDGQLEAAGWGDVICDCGYSQTNGEDYCDCGDCLTECAVCEQAYCETCQEHCDCPEDE